MALRTRVSLPASARSAAGAIALALSTAVLIGWIAHSPYLVRILPGWAPLSPSAALGLALVGLALLLADRRHRRRATASGPRGAWRVPLAAGAGAIALVVLFHQELLARQEHQTEATATATEQRIRTEIRSAVDAQRDTLRGLAHEWDDAFFKWRRAWESDARIALARSQGMSSIAWFEPEGELNWSYPADAEVPRVTLPKWNAQPGSVNAWTGAVTLADGSRGFALLAPLLDSGEIDGWLCGVFRAREFFGALSTLLPEGFSIRIEADRALIYDSGVPPPSSRWVRTLPLERGADATLTVYPTSEWLAQQRSVLPQVILVAGLLLSLLLVLTLRSAQLSAARAVALEGEVRAHLRAEGEIRRLNLELEDRIGRRTAELRRTNEELKGFASFLSHEMRQPISALALWADLLETESGASLDDPGRGYLAEIQRSVRRASDLIGAQLALAEISPTPPQVQCVDLDAVLDEVTSDLKPRLDTAAASVRRDSLLPSVAGDARQLYQLLRNLVENSIKYRRPGIPLEIRVSGRFDDDGAEILVADNGQGFDPADAERIFGAFERANESENEGLGLGLALCRRIMERCGGRIVARGRPGHGAAFEIRFSRPPEDWDPESG